MKWAKRIFLGLVLLIVLAAAGAAVFFYALHPKSRAAPDVKAPSTPEAIARGSYLANHVLGCVGCHTPIDETRPGDAIVADKLLSGREFVGDLLPGRLVGPNLTPDQQTGVGLWTDGELMRAIREGVDRNGHALFPIMPYTHFRRLPDDDTLAIIAYLRSVPPIARELPKTKLDFPVSMFMRLAPEPVTSPPPPWPKDPTERGKILLEMMGCIDCHTPIDKGKFVESKLYAGGNEFKGPFGSVHASNITSDPATGIGNYSDDDLMRAFREGKGKDGRTLWVMPWTIFQGTSDEDLRAVIAGLRKLPPIVNVVPAPQITK
jgi:mono/diheme cytochrome c family protein